MKVPKTVIEVKLVNKAVPLKKFKSIKDMDRYRRFILGLPVPAHYNKRCPWGYFVKPEEPDTYYPDEKPLRLLLRVRNLLRDYSYRDMSAWLTKAGYPISFKGLQKIMTLRQPVDEIMLDYEERLKLL